MKRELFAACSLLFLTTYASAGWFGDVLDIAGKNLGKRTVDEVGNAAYDGAKSGTKKSDNGSNQKQAAKEDDRSSNNTPKSSSKKQTTADNQSADSEESTAADSGSASDVYGPRYDFIPGEKLLFFDDFSDTDPGDYPTKWKAGDERGQLEVVEIKGKRWFKAIKPETSGDMRNSNTYPRVDLAKKLPTKYTVEFDVPSSGDLFVAFTDKYWSTGHDYVAIGPTSASTRKVQNEHLPASNKPIRHVAIAVSGTNVKVYYDDRRVLLDPEGIPSAELGSKDLPSTLGMNFTPRPGGYSSGTPRNDLMFTNFKVAEGGRDYSKDMAMSGRIVTHGITFDTGSDKIRPESGPTLRKILKVMQDNEEARFEVQGHTDNQGSKKVNQPLSEKRAAAVKEWLIKQGIDTSRLQSKGLGDTMLIDSNGTPEGRANNRRVEFVKL
jgi:outer membrane protein OmpA-like peptidoglycan-associated protein